MVANYGTVGSYLVTVPAYITIDFSEPVTVDGCLGKVTIMKELTGGQVAVVGSIDCKTGIVDGLKVRFKNTAAMATDAAANSNQGDYFVELEYGAVLDLAGNALARTSFATETDRVFQSTVVPRPSLSVRTTTFVENLNPALVFSEPRNGGTIAVDLALVPYYNLTVTLGFSTDIFYDATKAVVVKDCGATLVCGAVSGTGASVTQVTVDGAEVSFDLPASVAAVAKGTAGAAPLKRFVLEIEAGAFAGPAQGGGASTTALSAAMAIEFVVD